MRKKLRDLRNPKNYPTRESQLEALETLKMFFEYETQDTSWIRSGLVRLWDNPVLDLAIQAEVEAILGVENRPSGLFRWWGQFRRPIAIIPSDSFFHGEGNRFSRWVPMNW